MGKKEYIEIKTAPWHENPELGVSIPKNMTMGWLKCPKIEQNSKSPSTLFSGSFACYATSNLHPTTLAGLCPQSISRGI
jgi:hypothetical protein